MRVLQQVPTSQEQPMAQDFVLKSNNNEVLRTTTTGAVGINQPTPAATAILDIQSTTKGGCLPGIDLDSRSDAIVSPALGLTVSGPPSMFISSGMVPAGSM
jgi:hypothetical protein